MDNHKIVLTIVIVQAIVQAALCVFLLRSWIKDWFSLEWLEETDRPHRRYGFYIVRWEYPRSYPPLRRNTGRGIFTLVFNPWIAKKESDQ